MRFNQFLKREISSNPCAPASVALQNAAKQHEEKTLKAALSSMRRAGRKSQWVAQLKILYRLFEMCCVVCVELLRICMRIAVFAVAILTAYALSLLPFLR